MSVIRRARTWSVLVMVAAVSGCWHTAPSPAIPVPFSAHRSPNIDVAPPRRVLLLPVQNQTPFPAAAHQVEEILAGELQAAGLFELVRPTPREEYGRATDMDLRDGTFDEQQVLRLREQYRVDGVLIVTLTDLAPYWPQRIGCRAVLIDTRSGEVVASADGLWDGQDAAVRDQASAYFATLTASRTIADRELMHESPTLWTRFAMHQIVTYLAHRPNRLRQPDSRGAHRGGEAEAQVHDQPACR